MLFKKNLKHLHNLAKALLEFETLSGDDVKELISKGKIKTSNKNSDDTTSNKKTSIPLGKGKEGKGKGKKGKGKKGKKGKGKKGPKGGCYNCGGDHYASDCPKAGKGGVKVLTLCPVSEIPLHDKYEELKDEEPENSPKGEGSSSARTLGPGTKDCEQRTSLRNEPVEDKRLAIADNDAVQSWKQEEPKRRRRGEKEERGS